MRPFSFPRTQATTLLLTSMVGVSLVAPVHAQQPGAAPANAQPPAPGEVFRQVFGVGSAITGKNGYEDLVLAIEALRSSQHFTEAEPRLDRLTLIERRTLLRDRPIQRALLLMRRAVSKPVISPRTSYSFETPMPEFSGFRSLSRLLGLLQYVQLADGQTTEAIGTARLCLRIGKVVQTDTLLSALVGIAIKASCIRSLANHLDQLSTRDCSLLFDVCREWLAQPPPGDAIWQAELASIENFASTVRIAGPAQAPALLQKMLSLDEKQLEEARSHLRGITPETLNRLTSQSVDEARRFYVRAQEELRKPAWIRNRAVLQPDTTSSTSWLTGQVLTPMDRLGDAYTREQAQVRLLACHAAVLRYRWEKNSLPPTLGRLSLGEMAVDPFTGQAFQYRPQKRRYRLFSVGAPAEADDPQAVDGRRPVSLLPEE